MVAVRKEYGVHEIVRAPRCLRSRYTAGESSHSASTRIYRVATHTHTESLTSNEIAHMVDILQIVLDTCAEWV